MEQSADFIHFVIRNLGSGIAIGLGFAGLMLLTDTCGILSLIRAEPNWLLPAAVFVGGCVTSFATLVFATAIFLAKAINNGRKFLYFWKSAAAGLYGVIACLEDDSHDMRPGLIPGLMFTGA
jgi:hypothetical protein